VIELGMVQAKLDKLSDFPAELKTLIEHLIISHHGEYEFGSSKLPMFPEALMLHYLDDLDSKMENMRASFAREADSGSAWTGYNSSLGRPLLNTEKYLAKSESEKSEAAVAPEAAGPQGSQPALSLELEMQEEKPLARSVAADSSASEK
jgi:3'-5' exoribonuclease